MNSGRRDASQAMANEVGSDTLSRDAANGRAV
jgi:hypothetical protein